MHQVLLTSYEYIFSEFPSKPLGIVSISHNLGVLEHGKSLVFTSPVLKRWKHRCTTRSLAITSPFTSHILHAAAAALQYFLE